MERGQEGRPAHGSEESIEAIDTVEADAHGNVLDEEGAVPPGTEPEAAPEPGPPAHWLAYIRARAPWLLAPGGRLAAFSGAGPDVVPHGPLVRAEPWPAPPMRAPAGGDDGAPRVAASVDVGPGAEDGSEAVPPATAEEAAGGHPPTDDEPFGSITPRAAASSTDDVIEAEASAGERAPADDAAPDAIADRPPVEPFAGPAPHPTPVGAAVDTIAPVDHPGEARQSVIPDGRPLPLETPSGTPAAGPWPPLAAEPARDARPPEPWPLAHEQTAAVGPSPAAWASSAGPATGPTEAPVPPPPLTRPSPQPRARPWPAGSDGWRVRATPPDAATVARLALPAWPTLPDHDPDDVEPDWRAIERRRERTARLAHEQRRR